MPPGFSGNLIFAIIARMLCGNHLNNTAVLTSLNSGNSVVGYKPLKLQLRVFLVGHTLLW